jgi:allantoinase
MLPTERIAYSPITERRRLSLPDGARMAVWVIVNVEEWDPRQAMPRTVLTPPAGGSPMPDIPNWAWHEYGNRVGFWRFVDLFDALAIRPVLAINGSAIAAYPAIVRAACDRGWEFMGHGFTQRNMQKVEDERADIRKTRAVIAEATGAPPRGWLGPGLTETWETPTSWSKKATITSPIGCSTISRSGSRPEASRSSTCPTRRNATTSP